MPACNKDAFIDDIVLEPADIQIAYIEETYNVNIHSEGEGGRSHTDRDHAHTLTREDLEKRFENHPYMEKVTKFNTREDMWSSRHRWLEAFAPEMQAIKTPRHGQRFVRALGGGEHIGNGLRRDGREIGNLKNVIFVYGWDLYQRRWFEITGYPTSKEYVHRRWKKA